MQRRARSRRSLLLRASRPHRGGRRRRADTRPVRKSRTRVRRVIDRLSEGANTSRAAVVHARTLEVFEPLGVSRCLVERGIPAQRFTIRDRDRVLVPISFEGLPTRYPYTLMVSQEVTERVLAARLADLGGQVLRPRTLVALSQDESGATASLDDGSRLRARYIVGADGMQSPPVPCSGSSSEPAPPSRWAVPALTDQRHEAILSIEYGTDFHDRPT